MFVLRLTYFTQHNTPQFIYVEANGGYLSFLMAEEYSIVYIHVVDTFASFSYVPEDLGGD